MLRVYVQFWNYGKNYSDLVDGTRQRHLMRHITVTLHLSTPITVTLHLSTLLRLGAALLGLEGPAELALQAGQEGL